MNFNLHKDTGENCNEDILDMDYFRNNFSPPSSLKSESDYNNDNNKPKVKRRFKKIGKVKQKTVHAGLSNNSNSNSMCGKSWSGSSGSYTRLVKCHCCQEMKLKQECLRCVNRKCRERFCATCVKKAVAKHKGEASGLFNKQVHKK